MRDELLLPYLAGFIDGEGHIAVGINKNPKGERRWYLRFSCHQVNPAPLLMLKNAFGGSLHYTGKDGNARAIHEWVANSMDAYEAIKRLRPWLRVKADEADLAIEFQELLMARGTRRSALTAEEQERREDIYLRLKAKKHVDFDREETTYKLKKIKKIRPPILHKTKLEKPRSTQGRSGRPAKGQSKMPDAATLERDYRELGQAGVAAKYGTSRTTVYNWLDKYGIEHTGLTAADMPIRWSVPSPRAYSRRSAG